MTRSTRLSREDWLAAGFRKLADVGPGGLKAEVLARELGTTKGSFYWHFADLADFKSALLDLWRDKAATAIITGLNPDASAPDRLRALIAAAKQPAPEAFGGRKIEPAIRAWALSSAEVAAMLESVDATRLTFLEQLLQDVGVSDRSYAQALYGAFLGLDDLSARHSPDAIAALDLVVDMILTKAQETT